MEKENKPEPPPPPHSPTQVEERFTSLLGKEGVRSATGTKPNPVFFFCPMCQPAKTSSEGRPGRSRGQADPGRTGRKEGGTWQAGPLPSLWAGPGGGGVAGQTKPVSGQAWWLTGRKFGRTTQKRVWIKNAVSCRNWGPKFLAFILSERNDTFSEDSFLYSLFYFLSGFLSSCSNYPFD